VKAGHRRVPIDLYRLPAGYVDRILKMLWDGSGEPISIAALTSRWSPVMTKLKAKTVNDFSRCLDPLDMDATLIAVIEMSQLSWLVAGIDHSRNAVDYGRRGHPVKEHFATQKVWTADSRFGSQAAD
jgi:hypothetical protein